MVGMAIAASRSSFQKRMRRAACALHCSLRYFAADGSKNICSPLAIILDITRSKVFAFLPPANGASLE